MPSVQWAVLLPSMPMLVVENVTDGNRAYCNLNEGIGKVMRFGAYGEDVLTRHRWMRDVLMPCSARRWGAWSAVSISRR